MIRKLRALAAAALGLSMAGGALGEPVAPAGGALTAEQLAGAAKLDVLTIPTPGELLAAIDKLGKPDWASVIRPPIPTNYTSRAQMALNIGGLIADGYIAVEAASPQQVKNIGHDIVALAKPLGVGQDILNRGKSLTDFADAKEWETLKEEFEATQNEVKTAMRDNKDADLITLVTLGGWIRGTNAMASYVAAHYTEDAAKLLRQPGILDYLDERLTALPEKVRGEPSVRKARGCLSDMGKALALPAATPPSNRVVQSLEDATGSFLKELTNKK